MIYDIINILLVFAALSIGWWLYTTLYQNLRIDITRQRLFRLRDELFDIAADGNIPFDSKAYGMCRKTINGMIRYCHKIHFFRLLLDFFILSDDEKEIMKKSFTNQKARAYKDISDKQEAMIEHVYQRMNMIVLWHVIESCLPILIAFYLLKMFFKLFRVFSEIKQKVLNSDAANNNMMIIDAKAKFYGAATFGR